jgi:hypothetical protein
MNLGELKRLKEREKELLGSLEKLKKKEAHEVSGLKDEVKRIEDELEEVTRKLRVLESVGSAEPNTFVKFWRFLQKDTWQAWIVSLILLIVLIRFIFFPVLSFVTGSGLPLVVIESCSMYHGESFDKWWTNNADWYEEKRITKEEFESFSFKNGLNKGDIIFVWGHGAPDIGNVIIFNPNSGSSAPHPIIHRVIAENPYETKGDHNSQQLNSGNNIQGIDETNISSEQIVGRSVFRIPLLGWVKLVFFEPFRDAGERGFCK